LPSLLVDQAERFVGQQFEHALRLLLLYEQQTQNLVLLESLLFWLLGLQSRD
jgi:hypothetical protein